MIKFVCTCNEYLRIQYKMFKDPVKVKYYLVFRIMYLVRKYDWKSISFRENKINALYIKETIVQMILLVEIKLLTKASAML